MTKPHNKPNPKSAARFYAVQALFQMEATQISLKAVASEFKSYRIGGEIDGNEMVEADIALFDTITTEAVNLQSRIDRLTDRALAKNWPIDRIDPTMRAIFRAAGAELFATNTPPKVVISEYIELIKTFFEQGRESKFVNAVLDHMARDAKPDAFS